MSPKRKLASFFEDLQTRPFELQVWCVITAIASLRTLKAVVQDLIGKTDIPILVIDVFILLIFTGLCLFIYYEKIRRIPLIVGIALLLLLIFSYIQFGGVLGMSEFNLIALSVLFVLAYNRKELIGLMILYVGLILLANLDLRFNGWLTRNFLRSISTSLDNYFTTLITLLIVILYFKKALTRESIRVVELREKLSNQITTIQRQNSELEEQQQLLHKVNTRLEEEIRNHDHQIVHQNRAIQDYIWLSTESLQMPMQRIIANAGDLYEKNILESQLKDQVAELRTVVQDLKRELTQYEGTRR